MKLRFSKKCVNQIDSISDFLSDEIQMPETARQFINRLEEFAFSLLTDYKAYKTCKFPGWAVKGYNVLYLKKGGCLPLQLRAII